ncbi:MAG: phytanoyl-CoA dioxygenase family protein [Pseudomonadota bacterium]
MDTEVIKSDYAQDGYVVLERFMPDDLIEELRAETDRFVAAARSNSLVGGNFDVIDTPTGPDLRRIADPEAASDVYDRAMRWEPLVDLVTELLGGTCRFDHGKLNFKPPSGGGALDWHQDYAFYPYTNQDMLAVGIMIEDCTEENGPLMVIPGSHRNKQGIDGGPIFDHHQNGVFVGGVKSHAMGGLDETAVALTAPAGSISIHHTATFHASTANRGTKNRPLLLYNYFAADAFPVYYNYDWSAFNARLLRGEVVHAPRYDPLPCKVPQPLPQAAADSLSGSIYDAQAQLEGGAILST